MPVETKQVLFPLMIELPEAEYKTALTFPPNELSRALVEIVNRFAVARNEPEEADYDRPTNEADLEAIGRSLQAEAEGRIISGEVAFAQLRDRFKVSR